MIQNSKYLNKFFITFILINYTKKSKTRQVYNGPRVLKSEGPINRYEIDVLKSEGPINRYEIDVSNILRKCDISHMI